MMFRTLYNLRPSRMPTVAAATVALGGLYMAVAAQAPETAAATSGKEVLGFVMGIAGLTTLVAGIVWGLWNRKNYDKLKETIGELEDSCESKDKRIAELKLNAIEAEAKLKIELATKDTTIVGLKVSNLSVVSQNLQMKSILRGLRLSNKWEGHEDDVFQQNQNPA